MKLRSLIGFCALAVASVAVAADIEGNTCGLMNVPSTSEVTMIAVPWVNVGGGDVEVAKLVKTDTLTAGDELYYYNGSTYYRWLLSADKKWTPSATTKEQGGKSVTAEAPGGTYGVARGKGLTIVRQNPSAEIWLYGQADATAISSTVAPGTSSAPVYSLIANPTTADKNIKTLGGSVGDQILLNDKTLYTKDSTGWYTWKVGATVANLPFTPKVKDYDNCVIPAGQGAWYVSVGGNPAIEW